MIKYLPELLSSVRMTELIMDIILLILIGGIALEIDMEPLLALAV
jgi:hypothetical protein